MVPLRVKGEVIGTLALGRNQPCHPYTWADEVLLQDLADRAALEIENARLYQSVKENQDRLRALNVRLIKVQEAERRNIARKLHDEVGQLLTGLQITMKMSSRLPLEETRSRLDEAQKLVERLLDQVQTLSLDLRPTVLDDLGLALALSWQFERYTHQTGIQVQYDHRNIDRRFPSMIEAAAFRIVQEGLTNVARHAGVDKVSVRAWADDDLLGIQIEDQGTGFDVNSAMASHVSSGLSGMQEQAELLGGQLTIESSPGTGTLITVELPLRDIDGDNQDERDDNLAGG
jgi:signal transduction histidine kinase